MLLWSPWLSIDPKETAIPLQEKCGEGQCARIRGGANLLLGGTHDSLFLTVRFLFTIGKREFC